MPELAEVEHARRTWDVGRSQRVLAVEVSPNAGRVVRDVDIASLRKALIGQALVFSEARGKQLCFCFGKAAWLGLHLGMAGSLSAQPRDYRLQKHDLLALRQKNCTLVFTDLRHFGRIRFHHGTEPPPFWTSLPPAVLSPAFTRSLVRVFCVRRRRSPVKTVLLDQRGFPGIGNWMADEILWRARLPPTLPAGALTESALTALHRAIRWVSASALAIVDDRWVYPKTWLFHHRWEDGGRCPRCQHALRRPLIGGRRTCFCPHCQKSRR